MDIYKDVEAPGLAQWVCPILGQGAPGGLCLVPGCVGKSKSKNCLGCEHNGDHSPHTLWWDCRSPGATPNTIRPGTSQLEAGPCGLGGRHWTSPACQPSLDNQLCPEWIFFAPKPDTWSPEVGPDLCPGLIKQRMQGEWPLLHNSSSTRPPNNHHHHHHHNPYHHQHHKLPPPSPLSSHD